MVQGRAEWKHRLLRRRLLRLCRHIVVVSAVQAPGPPHPDALQLTHAGCETEKTEIPVVQPHANASNCRADRVGGDSSSIRLTPAASLTCTGRAASER